jgi:hypothetical protein
MALWFLSIMSVPFCVSVTPRREKAINEKKKNYPAKSLSHTKEKCNKNTGGDSGEWI